MARGAKKSSKTSRTATTTTTNLPATSNSPLEPFVAATTALLPLTDLLPRNHVYVVHLESTKPELRKYAFMVPVLLNLMIVGGLCWRLYYALPTYLEQIITIMGYDTKYAVEPKGLPWSSLLQIVLYRTFMLTIDYALFGLLGRWPWEFLFGSQQSRHVSACGWKWAVGFSRQKEPIVRRGRYWDDPLYRSESDRKMQGKPEQALTKEEELALYTKCSDGLRTFHTSKNALSMLDKNWDLDYHAMVDVAELLDAAKLALDDIDHVALLPWQDKWYVWYPNKASKLDEETQVTEKQDKRLERFKAELVRIDCEDVFYRWIEIVQYETSLPSGFTAAKKEEAKAEFKRMLEARHKDVEQVLSDIGGVSAIPGLNNDD